MNSVNPGRQYRGPDALKPRSGWPPVADLRVPCPPRRGGRPAHRRAQTARSVGLGDLRKRRLSQPPRLCSNRFGDSTFNPQLNPCFAGAVFHETSSVSGLLVRKVLVLIGVFNIKVLCSNT